VPGCEPTNGRPITSCVAVVAVKTAAAGAVIGAASALGSESLAFVGSAATPIWVVLLLWY